MTSLEVSIWKRFPEENLLVDAGRVENDSLGQLTSHPLKWPSFGKGENKSLLIGIVSQPHQTCFNLLAVNWNKSDEALVRHCNPSRIRNIKIERSKQLYHNNTLRLSSPLPKLGQWCDVSWPREYCYRCIYKFTSYLLTYLSMHYSSCLSSSTFRAKLVRQRQTP